MNGECSRIISASEVREVLSVYEPLLAEAGERAWDRWREISRTFAYTKRTRACFLADFFWEELLRLLPESGHRVVDVAGRKLLSIGGDLVAQWKKLNSRGLPSNFPTQGALKFDAGQWLPAIGAAPRITIGYFLDPLEAGIQEIRVMLVLSKKVVWQYILQPPVAEVLPVRRKAASTIPAVSKQHRRLTPKGKKKTDSGSSG